MTSLPGKAATGVGRYASESGLIQVQGKGGLLRTEFAEQRWTLRGGGTEGYSIKLKLLGLLPVTNTA